MARRWAAAVALSLACGCGFVAATAEATRMNDAMVGCAREGIKQRPGYEDVALARAVVLCANSLAEGRWRCSAATCVTTTGEPRAEIRVQDAIDEARGS